MWACIKKFSRDCVTGADNESYDLGRVLWAMAFVVGVSLEVACVWTAREFDLEKYGLGIGALLLAGGGALGLKAKTEPKHEPD